MGKDEIRKKREALLKELESENITEERMAAIEQEIDDLEKIEEEVNKRVSLKERLSSESELRSRLGDIEGSHVKGEDSEKSEERNARTIKETGVIEISALEARKGISNNREYRATTLESGNLAKPTRVGNDIRDNLESLSSIIDMVTVEDFTGCSEYDEPYEISGLTAKEREDGKYTESTDASDPVFGIAKIKPALISVTTYVSRNINRLTPVRYEEKIKAMALKALRSKVIDLIVNGNSSVFGIKTAKNTKNDKIYKEYVVKSNKITATTLKDIVFKYGGDDSLGGNAVLFLTKEDLAAFGSVRGEKEKKAIYEITPTTGNANVGTIKDGGTIVPYCICSRLTSLSTTEKGDSPVQTMLYGDPKNFELGLFGPYTIEVSKDTKLEKRLLTIAGDVMVGGNLVVHEGFVVVMLEANAASGNTDSGNTASGNAAGGNAVGENDNQ